MSILYFIFSLYSKLKKQIALTFFYHSGHNDGKKQRQQQFASCRRRFSYVVIAGTDPQSIPWILHFVQYDGQRLTWIPFFNGMTDKNFVICR